MDDQQYAEHMEKLRIIKKNEDIDTSHPLLKELRPKPEGVRDPYME